MSKKTNKNAQEEFLALELNEQIKKLNDVLKVSGTKGITDEFDFSYTWVQKIMENKGVYYVQSLKKFIKEEKEINLTDMEISEIKELLKDYQDFKRNIDKDVNLHSCIGSCGGDVITRSMVLDKQVSEELKEFAKKNYFIPMKDVYTSAIKQFIDRYTQE